MAACYQILFAALFVLVHSSTPQLHPIPSISVSCPNTLEGHWECGRQVGAQFRDRIESYFSKVGRSLYEQVQKTGHAQTVFNAMKATAKRVYPEYFQELNGTAFGSGQPFDLLLAENWAQEIGMALADDEKQQATSSLPDRCTDVLIDSAFAHNEDGGIEDFDTIYFVRMRTYSTEGKSVDDFAGITYAGRLPGWGPGWNSHGITWSSNVMYSKPISPAQDGLGVTFISRDTARATSIPDYIIRATPDGLMAGQNMNVGSVSARSVVTIETAPAPKMWDKLPVKDNHSPTFHANESLRLDTPQDEHNLHLTSARHRHSAYLRTPTIKNASGLLHFLGDTSDPVFPVFRRNDTTQEFTLFTVLFDLARGTAEFYRANPRLGEPALLWREFITPSNLHKVVV